MIGLRTLNSLNYNRTAPLDPDLLAWFKFDGNLDDSTGHGYTLSPTSTVNYATKDGFQGWDASNGTSMEFGTSLKAALASKWYPLTMTWDLYSTTRTGNQQLFLAVTNAAGNAQTILLQLPNADNRLDIYTYPGSAQTPMGSAIPLNAWTTLGWQQKAGSSYLLSGATKTACQDGVNFADYYAGQPYFGGAGANLVYGTMKNLRIYTAGGKF